MPMLEEREVQQAAEVVRALVEGVERIVVGQRDMVEGLLIGLLTGGHVLLEGVPGLAKTLGVSTLARAIHARFSRVQFTPDLLPADLIGTLIYNPREGTFYPRKGPIFANIVLADEVNRAPAKVQSALLEAMQERQVTIGEESYRLDDPFLVLATQNPIENEGTYQLPEAQVDRFMLKLRVGYPSRDEERAIVDRMAVSAPATTVEPIVEKERIVAARRLVDRIHIDERVKDYAVRLARATRKGAEPGLEIDRLVEYGASPRASIALVMASRARALLEGRAFVTPGDIKRVAPDVLRHRLILTYEAQAEDITTEQVVGRVLERIPTP